MEKEEELTREEIEKMSLQSFTFKKISDLFYKVIKEHKKYSQEKVFSYLLNFFLNLDDDLKTILVRNYFVNDLKFKEIPCIEYFKDEMEKFISRQDPFEDLKEKFKGIKYFEEIKGDLKVYYNQMIETLCRMLVNWNIINYYYENPKKFGNIYDTYNELKEKFNMDDYSAFGDLKDVGIEVFKTHFKNNGSKNLVGMIGDIAYIAKAIYDFLTSKDKWTEEKLFSLLKSFLDVAVSWRVALLNKTFLTPAIQCLYDLTFDVLIPVIKKILAKEEFQTEEIIMIVGKISIKVGYTVGIAVFPGYGIALSIGKLALNIVIDKTMREKIVGVFEEGAKFMDKFRKLGEKSIEYLFSYGNNEQRDRLAKEGVDLLLELQDSCIII